MDLCLFFIVNFLIFVFKIEVSQVYIYHMKEEAYKTKPLHFSNSFIEIYMIF